MFRSRLPYWLITLLLCALINPGKALGETDNSLRARIKIHKRSHLVTIQTGDTEEYNEERFNLLASKRKALIQDIKHFIRDAHDKEQKAELSMRLGSLYMEDYWAKSAKAQKVFQQQTAAYKANPKNHRSPKYDNSDALASLETARGIYRSLLARNPNHPRKDEMLYFLAVAAMERNQTHEAISYFTRLVDETPHSKYMNDALVQAGDFYFDDNQFAPAEKFYDKLITRKYRPLIGYAVYKKAWCAYNTKRTELALKDFKWVIQHETTEDPTSPVHVKKEALRDITLPFVDLKLVQESVAFFRVYGDPYYRSGVETMASLYQEEGDYKDSITLYKLLLSMDPNYPQNPVYEVSILEALRLSNQQAAAVARLLEVIPNYMKNSPWYEINVSNPKTVQTAAASFEEVTRKYAFDYHAHGQKLKNEAFYNDAKVLYSKYLLYFPHTQHSAQVHFYLAEILYKQNQFEPAADHYFAAYQDPNIGNLRYESIHYAVMSLDLEMNNARKKQGLATISTRSTSKLTAAQEEGLKPIPYSPVETKFVTVSDEYLKAYPKKPDAPEVLYEQAYLHYTHHELVQAYKSFWALVQNYPNHPTALASADLILDILNRNKDYPKLIAACQRFLQNRSFGNAKFRTEVADVLRHAELKRIQLVEDSQNYAQAAHDYVEYTKQYGEQDQALFEKALYNASVDYSKANNYMSAVETQEQFLRVFPKSTLRESMLLQVAKTYELFANFEKAGHYFELFANDYPQNTQAQDALRLAGLYYWGSGYAGRAENTMSSYIKRYPKDAKLVQKDLINLYESQGSTEKEIALYTRLRGQAGVTFSDQVRDTIRIAELQGKANGHIPLKTMTEARAIAEKHMGDLKQSPQGIEAYAKVMFWFANVQEQEFTHIKLTLPQSKMEENLQKKLVILKGLEKEYATIAKMGGEWGLGAMYKTAAGYRHLAQEIMDAPVPNELSAEQVDTYRKELQKQMIKPFKEKSLGLAEACLDKAQEFNLSSAWTPKCYALASEMQPDHYPLVRTFFLPSEQVSIMLPPKVDNPATPVGGVKIYPYPYYSTAMFNANNSNDRSLSSINTNLAELYSGPGVVDVSAGSQPMPFNYRALAVNRQKVLRKALDSERPADLRHGVSLAYLNLLRLNYPDKSLSAIMEAIQRDPSNQALHNLLGLAYLETGNFPAARVTWLAMIADGFKQPTVWNNLGVAAQMSGNEDQAMEFFHTAIQAGDLKEAYENIGFIALKYRNGFEAKKDFEKAGELDPDDVVTKVALSVGELQNREMDSAKAGFVELAKTYGADPYARISLSYYLVDVERDNQLAQQMLSQYMDSQSLENDVVFRQALQEAKHATSADAGELPTIDQGTNVQ